MALRAATQSQFGSTFLSFKRKRKILTRCHKNAINLVILGAVNSPGSSEDDIYRSRLTRIIRQKLELSGVPTGLPAHSYLSTCPQGTLGASLTLIQNCCRSGEQWSVDDV